MGIELSVTKPMKVIAKTLRIHCKVCDGFTASLADDRGKDIYCQQDGYVPSFMPGEHYGDYVILDIDLQTGMVTNWKQPSAEALAAWIATEQ